MAAAGDVEFGCVVAAAGAPDASDRDLYRGMLADCELYAQLGYDTAWVLEHHFSDYFPTPDPALLIAHLAGRYPELSYGACVIVTPWHHPLRLAGQIAMLTEFTDRPLHLGLGRGTAKLEFDAFGLDMGEARQRFAETWEILRLGMTGEPFSYPGKLRPVTQPVRIRPEPQTGQLHFYGAIGSPDSAAIMARLGLAPLCNTIGDIQQQAGTLRAWAAAAVEAGHSTAGVAFPIMIDCIVADTDEEAISEACRYKPRFMQAQIDHYAPHATDWVTRLATRRGSGSLRGWSGGPAPRASCRGASGSSSARPKRSGASCRPISTLASTTSSCISPRPAFRSASGTSGRPVLPTTWRRTSARAWPAR